jgi:hypothetical protein
VIALSEISQSKLCMSFVFPKSVLTETTVKMRDGYVEKAEWFCSSGQHIRLLNYETIVHSNYISGQGGRDSAGEPSAATCTIFGGTSLCKPPSFFLFGWGGRLNEK